MGWYVEMCGCGRMDARVTHIKPRTHRLDPHHNTHTTNANPPNNRADPRGPGDVEDAAARHRARVPLQVAESHGPALLRVRAGKIFKGSVDKIGICLVMVRFEGGGEKVWAGVDRGWGIYSRLQTPNRPTTTQTKTIQVLVDQLEQEGKQPGKVVDMETLFCSVSLDIIGKAVFNYDFG